MTRKSFHLYCQGEAMSTLQMYILRRVFVTIPVLWGVATLVFLVLYLTPGDPVTAILGEKAALSDVNALRHRLGLDLPVYVRYGRYIQGLLRGDMGRSVLTDEPVSREILVRMPATIELATFGVLFSITVGLLVGVVAAVFRRRWADYLGTLFSLSFVSVPGLLPAHYHVQCNAGLAAHHRSHRSHAVFQAAYRVSVV